MEHTDLQRSLSEEQALVAAAVAEFARDRVAPQHEALDHAGRHPTELWSELGDMGLFGTLVPEEWGGAGAGFVAHVLAVEGLARAGGLAGALVTAQGVVLDALLAAGDDALPEGMLDGVAAGTLPAAPALMEEDPGQVLTRARGTGEEVTLMGEKVLVPFPGRAGLYLVRALREDQDVLVLVEPDAGGLHHEEGEGTLGLHGFECGTLQLRETPGRVLGSGGLMAELLAGTRIVVSALLAGLARGALDHAVRYAGERSQFDRPIRDFAAVQERLVQADARTEGLRGLVLGAARLREANRPYMHAALRARVLAAEVAPRTADDALQVFGGYGYSREYPAERYYRDTGFPGLGEHVHNQLLAEGMDALES